MKIVKVITLTALGLSLVLLTGIFIFWQIFDTDAFESQINHQVSKMAGRPLSLGHLSLGISFDGLGLNAGPVVVADASDVTSLPLATIEKVRLKLDIVSLIMDHKISITQVVLEAHKIHIIRSQEGLFNVNTKESPHDDGPTQSTKENRLKPHAREKATRGFVPRVILQSIRVHDGAVSFIDQSQGLPLDVWVSDINMLIDVNDLTVNPSEGARVSGDIHLENAHFNNFDLGAMILFHALGVYSDIFKAPVNFLNGPLNGRCFFLFHDKAFFIDNMSLGTKDFELTAKGAIGADQNTRVETVFSLSQETSLLLAHKIKLIEFLLDGHKRLVIPATVHGAYGHWEYKVGKDFRKKIKEALKKEGTSGIIHDVLGFIR